MDAIVGACSATDGGAVIEESFNASSNKENESNADVQTHWPSPSSGRGNHAASHFRSRSNNAPSTLSTTSKARKRLFHDVDNTITSSNSGEVSNGWFGQFTRGCYTKFIRTFRGRKRLRLSSQHDRHLHSQLLRRHARQFIARRKSKSKKRNYYKSRIGPPTQSGNDNDLPYEIAIKNVADDLKFHSGLKVEAEFLSEAAIYLRERNAAAIRIQSLVRAMAARNLFLAIKSVHNVADDDEVENHDDDADETGANSDIELDEAMLQMDDAETETLPVTTQTQQPEEHETLEEVVPHDDAVLPHDDSCKLQSMNSILCFTGHL